MMKLVRFAQLLGLCLRNLVHALTFQIVSVDLRLILGRLVLTRRHVRQTLRLAHATAGWRPVFDGRILLHTIHCLRLHIGIR